MLHRDLLIRLSTARKLLARVPDSPPVLEVASSIGMSEYHFIRVFSSVFGETPGQYAISARVVAAKKLLRDTNLSVADISHQVGYESAGSFGNMFKRRAGIAPRQYRVSKRQNDLPPGAENLMEGCVSLMWALEKPQF